MGKIKGTRYVTLRKMVRERGPEFEKRFLEKLDPVERQRYLNMLPLSWVPLDEIPDGHDVVSAAADLFFPNDPQGIQKVAARIAKENLSGIYRIFMQIPKVEFVIKRVVKLWRTYNSQGDPEIENFTGHSGRLVVRNYPDMPAMQRVYLEGYIGGVMELSRAKNYIVKTIESDPQAWTWEISWDE